MQIPTTRDDETEIAGINLEARIYMRMGPHKHIIAFKGQNKDGYILLERARYGSVQEYLQAHHPGCQQRLKWARQATEGLVAVHQHRVLHRDIHVRNMLLDSQLDIKLCNLQGDLLGADGEAIERGTSAENIKSTLPRSDLNYAGWDTEIFALGSAFYYIMAGNEPFPELDSYSDEVAIEERFTAGKYPALEHLGMNDVVHKCWAGKYPSMEAVLDDIFSADKNSVIDYHSSG